MVTQRINESNEDFLIRRRQYNKIYAKRWHKKHPKAMKIAKRKYHQSEKGFEQIRRHNNKRKRNLCRIELNDKFENSDFHHLNKEGFGVYIPTEMHKSVSHCLETGQNMNEINDLAINYTYGD